MGSQSARKARRAAARRPGGGTLIEIDRGQVVAPIAPAAPHATYAEAVHRAVCEFSGRGGVGCCFDYAVAGMVLLTKEQDTLGPCYLQAGNLGLFPDPDSPEGLLFDASGGGMDRGEFHCWLALRSGVFIDFSTRQFPRMVETFVQHSGIIEQSDAGVIFRVDPTTPRASWRQPTPPDYLWGSPFDFPGWVRYKVDPAACNEVYRRIHAGREGVVTLGRLAIRHFKALTATH